MRRITKPTAWHKAIPLLMLTALCSCMGNAGYMAFHPFTGKGWEAMDTLTYPIDTLDREGNYGIRLLLHTDGYPYANISLNIVVKQDTTILLDTVTSYNLTDEPATKGIGYRNDYILPIGNVTFCDTLPATVQVTHRMADTLLGGIREVGIGIGELIEKSDEIIWHVKW